MGIIAKLRNKIDHPFDYIGSALLGAAATKGIQKILPRAVAVAKGSSLGSKAVKGGKAAGTFAVLQAVDEALEVVDAIPGTSKLIDATQKLQYSLPNAVIVGSGLTKPVNRIRSAGDKLQNKVLKTLGLENIGRIQSRLNAKAIRQSNEWSQEQRDARNKRLAKKAKKIFKKKFIKN